MKVFLNCCCIAGGIMIGFFANQLSTTVGALLFSLGVIILAGSILLRTKIDKGK